MMGCHFLTDFSRVTDPSLTRFVDNGRTMDTHYAEFSTTDSVQSAMDRAAEMVTELPLEQWGNWVAYFLESLDARAQTNGRTHAYIDALHSIQDGVALWLEGEWA